MRSVSRLAAALLGAAFLLAGGLGSALACAICLSAIAVTTGQKLDAADQVVLASPLPGGGLFRIVESVKGDAPIGSTVEASADRVKETTSQDGQLSLLARNGMSLRWSNFGVVQAENAGWLREFLKTNDGRAKAPPRAWPLVSPVQAVPDSIDWSKRISVIAPSLESGDPLVADIAFAELARAPYDVMRTLKPALDAADLRRWLQDPALVKRRDAYLLLLGIAGDSDDAAMLEERLIRAHTSKDATNVAALLAADLELRGPNRVAWIEENYLLDHSRSLPEIEAALLALSVHGGPGGVIPQRRVVDAYRHFIRERKAMAGFVATYLGDWQAWEVVPDYVDVLRSNAVRDPASEFAILVYLRASPGPEGRSAAEAFVQRAN
ncbi:MULTISPECIES: hypothetical protein [unclassified Chelatococcus]|uniref:hypothetical protein n=1 Tax=unclassified Chelatococcus TaxID=2638111 RepID=UPI001BCAF019|nr:MULTISPECIES: hypothetical protein [unclassified Chelatococcus]CAH1671266.1 conserved hypothetical protein [Hyphomicrobiales bacterium]MBS7739099.1 hypothetical protein [Chelatococcus sp. HY11]MBX3543534.1 hypothetical protein [Chelatococcus sp.]MCO5076371.1 hypothetical protein [Chelatococcus sp.]CAH1676538.1 conserved hypothetical protein [Hyphomicrobiales bacterium]